MISVNNLYKNAKKWMKDSGLTGNEFRFKRRFNSDMSLVSIWCIVSTGDEEMYVSIFSMQSSETLLVVPI